MAVTLNALTTGVGGLQTTGDTSGQISLQSNGSTVVAVTASGVSVTGTLTASTALGIGSGGTGATTATAAFDALNPMTTTGDIIYESTPSVAARLPIGSTGQVLTVAGGLPSWAAAAAGGFSQMTVFASPGTFTTPASTTRIKVTVVGGGGGGTGPAGSGVTGGTSSFAALASATGGVGGAAPTFTSGPGGSGSAGTLLVTGGRGTQGSPAVGGPSILGGGGATSGGGGSSNGGNYGGGGGSSQYGGGGGGGAIYVGPVTASTGYAVTVGAAGSAGPGGGAGGAGVVIVEF